MKQIQSRFLWFCLCLCCLNLWIFPNSIADNRDDHEGQGQSKGHDCLVDDACSDKRTCFFRDLALQFKSLDEGSRFARSLDDEIGAKQEAPGEGQVREEANFPILCKFIHWIHFKLTRKDINKIISIKVDGRQLQEEANGRKKVYPGEEAQIGPGRTRGDCLQVPQSIPNPPNVGSMLLKTQQLKRGRKVIFRGLWSQQQRPSGFEAALWDIHQTWWYGERYKVSRADGWNH